MGTPNKFNQLFRKSSKYSVFDYSRDVKLTMPIGKVVPIGSPVELNSGESYDVNLQELTRFLPTTAPVMQRYIVDFIPVFVPYRLLWSENYPIFNGEKFFNPGTLDSDRPSVPCTSFFQMINNKSGKIYGSLFDYLGYPAPAAIFQALVNNYGITAFKGGVNGATPKSVTLDQVLSEWSIQGNATILNLKFMFGGTLYTIGTEPTSSSGATGLSGYAQWLIGNYGEQDSSVTIAGVTSFEKLYEALGITNSQSAQDKYINYILRQMFNKIYTLANTSSYKDLSLLPWLCYHKAIADWFIRTDMIDPDLYMSRVYTSVYGASATGGLIHNDTLSNSIYNTNGFEFDYIASGECVPRLWMDDYFTTALSSPQRGAAVAIPVNGTIDQLATAERLNWFRKIVNLAGKRFKDQIYALWGYNIPDSRLQRTEVLGHLKFNMVVSDVLQTSQTDIDSALGNFAGQLTSSSGSHLLHYTAPEPGLVLVLGSVRPTTAYVDQVNRLIFKKDFYDFENPMFDNVGVQAIMNNELFYRPGDTSVFGYSPRRYAEYMQSFNEIHGQFKTTLDYWHSGRSFASLPGLNNSFITYSESDGLTRIFANQSDDSILMQVYMDAKVSRPLSRFINYHM